MTKEPHGEATKGARMKGKEGRWAQRCVRRGSLGLGWVALEGGACVFAWVCAYVPVRWGEGGNASSPVGVPAHAAIHDEAAVVEDPRELRLSDLLVDVADVNRPLDAVAVGALV